MKRSAIRVAKSRYHVLGLAFILSILLSACGGGSESTDNLSSAEQGQASGGIVDFSYTGANQFFSVPEGVTELVLDLWGAGGESASADLGGADCEYVPGGGGGYVNARIPVTPGEVLTVRVGGAPANHIGAGWPDGGNGWLDQVRMGRRVYTFGVYGGGGGSSSILRGDTVLVEAGGGNSGFPCTDPVGGGVAGTCSPSGNQRGNDYGSTGGSAGGGGWCGGGPDTPSVSGAAAGTQWSFEAASGQTPGASTHPSRQGSGEGGFTSHATHGRVYLSWNAPAPGGVFGIFEPLGGVMGGPNTYVHAQQISVDTPTSVARLGTYTRHFPIPFRMGLYTDAGGVPGTLILQTPFVENVLGRNEISVAPTSIVPGRYWIAIQFRENDGYIGWFPSPVLPNAAQAFVDVSGPLPAVFTPSFPVSNDGAVNLYFIGTP